MKRLGIFLLSIAALLITSAVIVLLVGIQRESLKARHQRNDATSTRADSDDRSRR